MSRPEPTHTAKSWEVLRMARHNRDCLLMEIKPIAGKGGQRLVGRVTSFGDFRSGSYCFIELTTPTAVIELEGVYPHDIDQEIKLHVSKSTPRKRS